MTSVIPDSRRSPLILSSYTICLIAMMTSSPPSQRKDFEIAITYRTNWHIRPGLISSFHPHDSPRDLVLYRDSVL
jgi:hypothetical protein